VHAASIARRSAVDLRYAGRRVRFGVFLTAIVMVVAACSQAQNVNEPILGDGSRAPRQAAAQEHFERVLAWYRAGKYRLARRRVGP
jgi:hypothetical protein